MKVPIRLAPPPPVNQKLSSDSAANNGWKENKSVGPVQKKKPPPRPPPPKFACKNACKTTPRTSQLIAGLFQRKNNLEGKRNEFPVSRPVAAAGDAESNGFLLIDLSSPPSSPTFTTRSSSDALSVNSFGSDGVAQGSSGSSGNGSNVESGFEDDFDLFPNRSRRTESFRPRDPWSPVPRATPSEPKNPFGGKPRTALPSAGAMPTIIRSKPEGCRARPKVINCDSGPGPGPGPGPDALWDPFRSAARFASAKSKLDDSIFEEEDDGEDVDDGHWSSESPPMPSCPPPPPPPEFFDDPFQSVDNQAKSIEEPHGIALYDYEGEISGDLSFRKGEIIFLVRRIDENWLAGRKDGLEGTVPANFVSIRVPPAGEKDDFVTALYPFRAETEEDLGFEEGSIIKVTHRLDPDWLFGECNGKSGQFPVNFVDRVPDGLPLRRTA